MALAPWLQPPNFLAAMEGGTNAGLALRRQADDESQFAARMAQAGQEEQARQDDAAQRLKLSYDSLAQQHDLSQQEIAARGQQAQAANALRQQSADSLNLWRQQQAVNAQQRIKDQETKLAAAESLKKATADDVQALYTDAAKDGLAKAAPKHHLALTVPGIESAVAAALLNPKAKAADKTLSASLDLSDPANPKVSKVSGPLPLLQNQMGTNLPASLQPTPLKYPDIYAVRRALKSNPPGISRADAEKYIEDHFADQVPKVPDDSQPTEQ